MGLFSGNIIYDIISVLFALLVIILTYYKWTFGYWKRKNVPYIEPSMPFGNTGPVFTQNTHVSVVFKQYYDEFKRRKVPFGGVFSVLEPHLLAVDLNLVKHILQVDFVHFMNHGIYINEKDDPLTGHLFMLEDAKWRNLRIKLTPTFTSGKIKMMYQTLLSCTKGLKEVLDENLVKKEPVDIKLTLQRYTIDVIGSVGFGIECNCLKDPNTDFVKFGRKIFDITPTQLIKFILTGIVPTRILHALKFKVTRPDVEEFFLNLVDKIVKHREDNNIFRRDFMHLLLQLKNRGKVTDDENIFDPSGKKGEAGLSMNELAAQAFVFFLAGFETSSTTMTFCLYELATNPEVQEKAREEILKVLEENGGELTYEAVMNLKYLDRVLEETLRKYPPFGNLFRVCTKDYKIPNSDVVIKKGTRVEIPAYGIHYDPEYYPDPEKFDPDRFTQENKAKRPQFTWLPFGDGPRVCIGLRFGLLQSKVGLVTLLKNYRITLNEKTQVPLHFNARSVVLSIEGQLWVNLEKI